MKYWAKKSAVLLVICACLIGLIPIETTRATETTQTTENTQSTETEQTTENTEITEPTESTEPTEPGESTETPALSETTLEVKKGKTKTLSVKNATKTVKWSSSNEKIATVSSKGVVTGVKCGTVKITAEVGEKTLTCKVMVYASKKYVKEWVEKDGRYYYYNKYGEKVTGLATINKKTYYFDKKGRQRTGWVKKGGSYYFFATANKSKGYMEKSTKVNGVKLDSDGAAKLTSKTDEKARLLTAANEFVFNHTKSTMSKEQKLKAVFKGLATQKTINYKNIGAFKKGSSKWDEIYASYFLDRGYGDCYVAGCAMAYLATAIGCENVYAQSSGGHGWAKVDGKYYDPNWAWWGTGGNIYRGFAVPASKSGSNHSPNWVKGAKYSKKIS
jgi:hypothetical protein